MLSYLSIVNNPLQQKSEANISVVRNKRRPFCSCLAVAQQRHEDNQNAISSYPISRTEACRILPVRGCQCIHQAIGEKNRRDQPELIRTCHGQPSPKHEKQIRGIFLVMQGHGLVGEVRNSFSGPLCSPLPHLITTSTNC